MSVRKLSLCMMLGFFGCDDGGGATPPPDAGGQGGAGAAGGQGGAGATGGQGGAGAAGGQGGAGAAGGQGGAGAAGGQGGAGAAGGQGGVGAAGGQGGAGAAGGQGGQGGAGGGMPMGTHLDAPAGARACEAVLVDESGTLRGVEFGPATEGRARTRGQRTAVAFIANADMNLPAGAVQLMFEGPAAALELLENRCFDAQGAVLPTGLELR